GAMRVATLMKGVYDLVKTFSTRRTLPRHEDPVPCFQEVALWVAFAELAYFTNGDMFPSWGHVDIESEGPDPVVSASPASSRVFVLVVALVALAVLCSLWRAFVPADAYTLEDALGKL